MTSPFSVPHIHNDAEGGPDDDTVPDIDDAMGSFEPRPSNAQTDIPATDVLQPRSQEPHESMTAAAASTNYRRRFFAAAMTVCPGHIARPSK